MKVLHLIGCCAVLAGGMMLPGCLRTHNDVVISQPKPLEVNVNLKGKLTLVIQDAHSDMDFIADQSKAPPVGEAHQAPATQPTSAPAPGAGFLQDPQSGEMPVIYADAPAISNRKIILEHLRADFHRCHQLLAAHLTGEAHTGFMVARAPLNASDAHFMKEDNHWRKALYELRAKQTGHSVAQIGHVYFAVRVKYAPNGSWVQSFDQSSDQWVWIQLHK